MDNGHHAIFSPVENTAVENATAENTVGSVKANTPDPTSENALDQPIDEASWRKSLDISRPVDLPTPIDLLAPANSPTPAEFSTTRTTNESILSNPTLENSTTINSTSIESASPASSLDQPEPNFGQILPLEPTSGAIVTTEQSMHSYNSANIKTTGDKLEKSSIAEVDSAIAELNQTGNLSNFYDEIRGEQGMTAANLQNSFNRTIGGDATPTHLKTTPAPPRNATPSHLNTPTQLRNATPVHISSTPGGTQ